MSARPLHPDFAYRPTPAHLRPFVPTRLSTHGARLFDPPIGVVEVEPQKPLSDAERFLNAAALLALGSDDDKIDRALMPRQTVWTLPPNHPNKIEARQRASDSAHKAKQRVLGRYPERPCSVCTTPFLPRAKNQERCSTCARENREVTRSRRHAVTRKRQVRR